jgi:hypothetical protein
MPVTRRPAESVFFGSAMDLHNFISDRNYKRNYKDTQCAEINRQKIGAEAARMKVLYLVR